MDRRQEEYRVADLSSLPTLVDPTDWLDEELPTIGHGWPGDEHARPDADGLGSYYRSVADLDPIEVSERASPTAQPEFDNGWDAEFGGLIASPGEFPICQNNLNR
jgi:hypothetical protein